MITSGSLVISFTSSGSGLGAAGARYFLGATRNGLGRLCCRLALTCREAGREACPTGGTRFLATVGGGTRAGQRASRTASASAAIAPETHTHRQTGCLRRDNFSSTRARTAAK